MWRKVISEWISMFDKHRVLAALGQGIVRSIRPLMIDWMTADAARGWRDIWHELGGEYPQLEVPLRLLDAAVEYLASRDPRVLLRLPQEERSVLKPLLPAEKSHDSP